MRIYIKDIVIIDIIMFSNPKIDDKSNIFSIEIKNVDLSFINAIRRIILTNIPTVGFSGEENPSLEIIENNGPLHNEIILHRFGLIPIHFNSDETETFNEDEYEFEINVDNNTESRINVTTKDFKVKKNDLELNEKDVKRLFPPCKLTDDYILITRLQKGQKLHIKGKAIKNTAFYHSGFSPVSLSNFKYVSDPSEIIKQDNILDKERAFLKNEYGEPTSFIFEIECENALSPKYLISKSIEILMTKIHNVIDNINTTETRVANNNIGYEFVFENEDDTLGYFLQSLMHNHYIRDKKKTEKNKEISYIGYYCPHPLDTNMVLRVSIKESDDIQEYKDVLYEHLHRSLEYLQNIQSEFIKVM
jgi:DNA-directed RNA polymerase alpha subunit